MSELSVEARLATLVEQLGIRRAHVGGGYAADAVALARACPSVLASMTLVCPYRLPPEPFAALGDRLLLIHGDRGPGAGSVPQLLKELPSAREVVLTEYEDAAWSDAVRERRATIEAAMLPFLEEREQLEAVNLPQGEGEVVGITYRVRGH